MAIIPTVKRRVRAAPAPDQTSPDFEGEFHRAKGEMIGGAIRQVGGALEQVMAEAKERGDKSAVRDAKARMIQLSTGAITDFRKLQGAEVYGKNQFTPEEEEEFQGPIPAAVNHREEFDKAREKIMSGLTPSQQDQFRDEADRIDQQLKYDMLVHETAQQKVMDKAIADRLYVAAGEQLREAGAGKVRREDGSAGYSPGTAKALEDMKEAIRENVGHLGEDEVNAVYGRVVSGVIEEDIQELIKAGLIGAAQQMQSDNSDMIEESDRIKINDALRGEAKLQIIDGHADKFMEGKTGHHPTPAEMDEIGEYIEGLPVEEQKAAKAEIEDRQRTERNTFNARVQAQKAAGYMYVVEHGKLPPKSMIPDLHDPSGHGLEAFQILEAKVREVKTRKDTELADALIWKEYLSLPPEERKEVKIRETFLDRIPNERLLLMEANQQAEFFKPTKTKTAPQTASSTVESMIKRQLKADGKESAAGNSKMSGEFIVRVIADVHAEELALGRKLSEEEMAVHYAKAMEMVYTSDWSIGGVLAVLLGDDDEVGPIGAAGAFESQTAFDNWGDEVPYSMKPPDQETYQTIRYAMSQTDHWQEIFKKNPGMETEDLGIIRDREVEEFYFYYRMGSQAGPMEGVTAALDDLEVRRSPEFAAIPEDMAQGIVEAFADNGIDNPSAGAILSVYKEMVSKGRVR
jgi:hypothetical protein